MMGRLFVLALLAATVACDSSSAPAIVDTSDANIAGTYANAVVTNADLATWVGCTGDLATLEGLTIATTAVACTSGPVVVIQVGNSWRTAPQSVVCGTTPTKTVAAGTVTGDVIDGRLVYDSTVTGVEEVQTIVNGAALPDGTVLLRIPGASVSGTMVGACSISPPAETVLGFAGAPGSVGSLLGGV